ncbi:MAG: pentapeptide repeat-containing protein [Candidatus Omnitrophica bacterium]|nr:pentapeptide repeat-containing protein [Candidatus Omnitrophota bacterium]
MKCAAERCVNASMTGIEYCWDHLKDKAAYRSKILAAVNSGEDLSGYNLQKIDLANAHLAKARLSKANLSQANLSGSHIFDSDLENADMVGADLSNCELANCGLKGADLTKARLTGARLWNADLVNANLAECDLSGSDLWCANLFNAKLWHTTLTDARSLSKANFSSGSGVSAGAKINEGGLISAEESYRDLKKYFLERAMHNDASWASFKEKTMERLILKKNGSLRYIPSLIMSALCGYGEKPSRIVLSALSTILLFAAVYFSLGSVQDPAVPDYAMKWGDYLYYSAITFTTVGYGDFVPKPSVLFRLLAAAEAFSGVFLSGLFIFTLARRYSAR